jgi:hypothetical protein
MKESTAVTQRRIERVQEANAAGILAYVPLLLTMLRARLLHGNRSIFPPEKENQMALFTLLIANNSQSESRRYFYEG